MTGQRKDQSPTRADVPLVQLDTGFSGAGKQLIKYNPLANWSSADVWSYIRMMEIPYNPLHERGFVSIGCEPCTKPVLPNQHEREGRWWWEDEAAKDELLAKIDGNFQGVPVTDIAGEMILGFNRPALQAALEKNALVAKAA